MSKGRWFGSETARIRARAHWWIDNAHWLQEVLRIGRRHTLRGPSIQPKDGQRTCLDVESSWVSACCVRSQLAWPQPGGASAAGTTAYICKPASDIPGKVGTKGFKDEHCKEATENVAGQLANVKFEDGSSVTNKLTEVVGYERNDRVIHRTVLSAQRPVWRRTGIESDGRQCRRRRGKQGRKWRNVHPREGSYDLHRRDGGKTSWQRLQC